MYSNIKHFMKYSKGYIFIFVAIVLMTTAFCSCNSSTANRGENIQRETIPVEPTISDSPTKSPNLSADTLATIVPTEKMEQENTPEVTTEIATPELDVSVTIQPTENPEDSIDYESFVPSGALTINEAMSVNDTYLKQNDGKCYDWVEIKNISNNDVVLSDYFITDKFGKMKYKLPNVTLESGKVYVVICSSKDKYDNSGYYHTNFSISASEEKLYLYDSNESLIDAMSIEAVPYGYSFGRIPGNEGVYYFNSPTPNSENKDGIKTLCKAPIANYAPGTYSEGSLEIEFESDGIIYYTTDGTEPTTSSFIYVKPIRIDKNTVIRTLVCKEGAISSNICTYTYILNKDDTLPVLSLVTAPDNLWSEETGIYVKGKYDNYYQDWEKEASISYFGEDGTFSLNCGLKMHGAGSRESNEKKSFKVIFRGKYGKGTLKYDLFNSSVDEFDSLILRAGEDAPISIIRNEVAVNYASKYFPSLITQKGKYCSLYINGEYFGIYYLMERVTDKFVSDHFGVPEEDVIIEEYDPTNNGELDKLMTFAQNNDMTIATNYDYIASKIDLESMTDWFIFQAFTGNTDAAGNIRYVKAGKDAKWKWVAYDLDWAFYFHKKPFENVLINSLGITSSFIKPLLKNENYRLYFIQRFSYYANNVFNDSSKLIDIIDYYYTIIESEVPKERKLWGGSYEGWKKKISELKAYVVDYDRCKELKESIITTLSMTQEEIEKYF